MQLALNTTESFTTVENLDFNTKYFFCIKAIIDGKEKQPSNIVSYNLSKYIAPVENLIGSVVLTKRDGMKYAHVTLKWDKSERAEWYIIGGNILTGNWTSRSNYFEKEIPESSVLGGLPDTLEEIGWTTKYRYSFSVTACGLDKYISPARSTGDIKLSAASSISDTGTNGNSYGLRIEESPAYPLVLHWNEIDGVTKYRLWYSYKKVDYENAHHEDIEGLTKKFYGAWNSGWYFWLEPLSDKKNYPISSPIYGVHPPAPTYDKETLDNSSGTTTSSSTSSSTKHSYTY